MEDNELKWYVLHTYSGYENMVQENLKKMVDNNNLQDFVTEVVVPIEDDVVEKNGKKKVVQRKKFPSYVFIKMVYTNHIWYMVTNTRGVTGFVGPSGRPLPLTNDEVKRMGLEVFDVSDIDVAVGDKVKIISGALENFIGEVKEVSAERQKVRVIVSMFGRMTPVELEFAQIEKL